MGSPRLPVAAVDAWRLCARAASDGLVEGARVQADRAVELSSWEAYRRDITLGPLQVRLGVLVPRGWAYYQREGWVQRLLIHPDAVQLVADFRHLEGTFAAAAEHGPGLIRLSEVLADILVHALTPPDDLAELV